MEYYTLPTSIGVNKLRDASVEQPINITRVVFGDAKGQEYLPTGEESELINQVFETAPSNIRTSTQNANWIEIEAIIPHNLGGWTIREVGCFDQEGDLIFIGNLPPSSKPNSETGVIKDIAFVLIYDAAAADVVQISINPELVLASRKYVDDENALHLSANDPHHQYLKKTDALNAYLAKDAQAQSAKTADKLGDIPAGDYLTETEGDERFQRLQEGSIPAPIGATFSTESPTLTGPIKIKLPQSWTATMLGFTVNVFEYGPDQTFKIMIAGYNFISGHWNNPSAFILGGKKNYKVRFGHDGDKCCVYIGEDDESWSYPQVSVVDFVAGYARYEISNWHKGWSILIGNQTAQNITGTLIADAAYSAENKPTAADVGALAVKDTANRVYCASGTYINSSNYGSNPAIEMLQATPQADSFISFHVSGDFAFNFGLHGATNKLSVGGGSLGADNVYEIYHEGNKPTAADIEAGGLSDLNTWSHIQKYKRENYHYSTSGQVGIGFGSFSYRQGDQGRRGFHLFGQGNGSDYDSCDLFLYDGSKYNRAYHEGFKPTTADVGALAVSSGGNIALETTTYGLTAYPTATKITPSSGWARAHRFASGADATKFGTLGALGSGDSIGYMFMNANTEHATGYSELDAFRVYPSRVAWGTNTIYHEGNLTPETIGALPVFRGAVYNVTKDTYTPVCRVQGDRLASAIKLTIHGTGSGNVVDCTLDILCNHYKDIVVSSLSGSFTQLDVKIESNGNEVYVISIKTGDSSNDDIITSLVWQVTSSTEDQVTTWNTDPNFTVKETHVHSTIKGSTNLTSSAGAGTPNHHVEGKEVYHAGNLTPETIGAYSKSEIDTQNGSFEIKTANEIAKTQGTLHVFLTHSDLQIPDDAGTKFQFLVDDSVDLSAGKCRLLAPTGQKINVSGTPSNICNIKDKDVIHTVLKINGVWKV
ncbi:hypothetical protein CJF42_22025 [Pseudoalteromonas sp. NBT06-2]|uniref:phage tail protein n=1 Tax=Pseudoalteromonas sp. NBT06-2 TaxID=2025950 RepID=UPI000BA6DF17|nr:phage tail protein [Pseudoalteromonas sp. NBT06-2]PAJ72298.1 hypothetical protein CJF42_22025 [Pseudoalteromonas sp. NBT06-2]